jgi:hypothetical protein
MALVLALVVAGWSIYRRLPDDVVSTKATQQEAQTALHISLRGSATGDELPSNVKVELFPIDIIAARNEFFSERRPGMRLEEFLAERMGNRAPVEGRFDRNGEATVMVKPGPWWVHATLPGELNIEWRLRINVSGNRQSVELTPDNAYTRTRSF